MTDERLILSHIAVNPDNTITFARFTDTMDNRPWFGNPHTYKITNRRLCLLDRIVKLNGVATETENDGTKVIWL